MRYPYIASERNYFCVPASLQIIFSRRNFKFDTQEEIFSSCGGIQEEGILLEKGLIDKYVRMKGYSLRCIDFCVRESPLKEFEQLVEDALHQECDVLCSFAYENFIGKTMELIIQPLWEDMIGCLVLPFVSPLNTWKHSGV